MARFSQDLQRLGIETEAPGGYDGAWFGSGDAIAVRSPINQEPLATVRSASAQEFDRAATAAVKAFKTWRDVPAPKRGEVVRAIGDALRKRKTELGRLVTIENGKILQEGLGEVQEAIDMADYCTGLSRQLYGLTIASERQNHRMYEQWHPLGPVGIVTAFNFPVAVWSWNSLLAAVCGDSMVWKPSSSTPLCAVAATRIAADVLHEHGAPAIMGLACGPGVTIGQRIAEDPRFPLVSATGSCEMGHRLAPAVAKRMGRTLLELGGNNGVIVAPTADQDIALRAILFGAVGTAGQRCTSIRRLLVHKSVARELTERLTKAYEQLNVGDPLSESTHVGPLINAKAVEQMQAALQQATKQGGRVITGGDRIDKLGPNYARPALVEARPSMGIVQVETFAPILYVMTYDTLEEAIDAHNAVPQGLSSAIFTNDVRESEAFLGARGSDCGIANVNIGTSGAEIGGAFGGEKETGGGREAGSDAWKAYMRRQTVTVNYGHDVPLAQGIRFDVPGA